MKIGAIILCLVMVCVTFAGCSGRQSDQVSYNLSMETDTVDHQLEVTVEVEKGVYKKHFIYLNSEWVTYVVEDISGADVNSFVYEVNYLPETFKFIDIVTKD